MGYFGTYKKLETLVEAFTEVRSSCTEARLQIAGSASPHTPAYIENLFNDRVNNLQGIEFLGYLLDDQISELFRRSNSLVITNSDCAGSSGPIRLAGVYGRPIIAPKIGCLSKLSCEGWSIRYYPLNDVDALANEIKKLLYCHKLQNSMGRKNYLRAKQSGGQWLEGHRRAFREIFQANNGKK